MTTGTLRMCFVRLPPPLQQGEKHLMVIYNKKEKVNAIKEHLLIHVESDIQTNKACKKF